MCGRSGKKKWLSSEDESELGELPPPPVIISDPNSMMPEKGILKSSCPKLADGKRGSDSGGSQQRGSASGGSYVDQDSVGTYNYDDDDDLEIREIFRDRAAAYSMDNLDNMPESASFDFVIPPPPPPPQFLMQSIFPSPPGSSGSRHQRAPLHEPQFSQDSDCQPLMWRTPLPPQTLSPPQSRIVRLRNFNDLMARFDKSTTVDLSPSPDEPPVQLSPSTCTSEDVRSSETEPDRAFFYQRRPSHSDHSPTSVASSCTTQHTFNSSHNPYGRPSIGNLNQYLLSKTNNLSGDGGRVVGEQPSPHPVHMPPPMHPINIRSILGMGHGTRESSETPQGSQGTVGSSRDSNNETPQGGGGGDASSLTGTANSKNGGCLYEKSSGYGSEHDLGERLSMEENCQAQHSLTHSRSQSASPPPPPYSAVIRTGPNRIQLVAPGRMLVSDCADSGSQEELQRLLEGLPRIDAGSFERSPLLSAATPGTPSTGPILPPSKLGREPGEDAPRPLLQRKPSKDSSEDSANLPCIDRSLEEIPQAFGGRY